MRTISTPPGLPWDQQRAADLEARHGSPLPLAEVLYQLRRLQGWRPGAPGRFAAFYVLAREVGDRLDAAADVDGQPVAVTFVVGGARIARAGQTALVTVAVAALVILSGWSIWSAFSHRGEAAVALQVIAQRTEGKARRIEILRRGQDLDQALALELRQATPLKAVLDDLSWVSAAKKPEARIVSLHWEAGLAVVGAKGEDSPLQPVSDREVHRAKRPLAGGVWLWGITSAPSPAAAAERLRAEP